MRRVLPLIFALVFAAALTPARADTVAEVDYFHCAPDQSTPIVTVNTEVDASTPSWSQKAPTGSLTTASGCVGVTDAAFTGLSYRTPYDTPFLGYFTGNIDSITVRAYFAAVRGQTQNISMLVHLGIDGKSMFGDNPGTTGTGPGNGVISIPPTHTAEGLSVVEFTITKIGWTDEPGTGDTEHEVALTLGSNSEPVSLLLLDSMEAPSGLTFNPETPATAQLKAKTPGP